VIRRSARNFRATVFIARVSLHDGNGIGRNDRKQTCLPCLLGYFDLSEDR
jgi:hypothetical protein